MVAGVPQPTKQTIPEKLEALPTCPPFCWLGRDGAALPLHSRKGGRARVGGRAPPTDPQGTKPRGASRQMTVSCVILACSAPGGLCPVDRSAGARG